MAWFWEAVQYALCRATEAAITLSDPSQQELIVWQTAEFIKKNDKMHYIIHTRSSWLQRHSTIVADVQGVHKMTKGVEGLCQKEEVDVRGK